MRCDNLNDYCNLGHQKRGTKLLDWLINDFKNGWRQFAVIHSAGRSCQPDQCRRLSRSWQVKKPSDGTLEVPIRETIEQVQGDSSDLKSWQTIHSVALWWSLWSSKHRYTCLWSLMTFSSSNLWRQYKCTVARGLSMTFRDSDLSLSLARSLSLFVRGRRGWKDFPTRVDTEIWSSLCLPSSLFYRGERLRRKLRGLCVATACLGISSIHFAEKKKSVIKANRQKTRIN